MPTVTEEYSVKFYHADHGLTDAHKAFAVEQLCGEDGFVLVTVDLPGRLGDLDNALYGPRSGDLPQEGEYSTREGREHADKMVDLPARPSRRLTVIGVINNTDKTITIFTAHGGEAAEKNLGEVCMDFSEGRASQGDVERSAVFWSEHALAK